MRDRRAELEAAIEAAPLDRSAYEVYADELQRLGDPRGELISLHLAPDTAETQSRVAALIAAHDFAPPLQRVTWGWGFIEAAILDPADPSVDISAVLDHPSLRFLSLVTLVAVETGVQQAIDAIARRPRPALRALRLGGVSRRSAVPDHACDLGALDALWPAVPNLERLFLTGQNVSLGALELPELRWLFMHSASLRDEHLVAVLDQAWPALEALELWAEHAAPTPATLASLFTHPFPSLHSLSLKGHFLDDVIEHLVRWPRLPELQQLILFGGLTDRGAAAIVQHASAFEHLDVLDVSDNYLSPVAAASLTRIAREVQLDEQRDLEERDPDLYDY